MPGHVFLRHPPLPQMQGRCYGRLDIALPDDVHVAAATTLRDTLPEHPLWSLPILSSPAQRCHGLARACAGGRAVAVEPRLLEMDFGEWEGRAWSDVPREALDRWAADVVDFQAPGGESFRRLVARVDAALAALDTPHLIVCHGGVIRAATHLLGDTALVDAAAVAVPYLQPITFPPRIR